MATKTSQIGQALRGLRKAAGLTLADVSHLADTAPAYLSKVESGALTPSTGYVARVASAIADQMKHSAELGAAA